MEAKYAKNAKYARWLRDSMTKAGVRQAQLARELSVDPTKVSRWLKGERAIKAADLERLARYLGVPVLGEERASSRQRAAPGDAMGQPQPVPFLVPARALADEMAWRDSQMEVQSLSKFPPRPAVIHPLFDADDQFYVPIHSAADPVDPNIVANYVICGPIEKLDRRVRAGDWVYAREHRRNLARHIVRKVESVSSRLVLRPIWPAPGLEDLPIDQVEVVGIVLAHQQDRRI